jgi:hypothetical protein
MHCATPHRCQKMEIGACRGLYTHTGTKFSYVILDATATTLGGPPGSGVHGGPTMIFVPGFVLRSILVPGGRIGALTSPLASLVRVPGERGACLLLAGGKSVLRDNNYRLEHAVRSARPMCRGVRFERFDVANTIQCI